jgi:hypothetical protein
VTRLPKKDRKSAAIEFSRAVDEAAVEPPEARQIELLKEVLDLSESELADALLTTPMSLYRWRNAKSKRGDFWPLVLKGLVARVARAPRRDDRETWRSNVKRSLEHNRRSFETLRVLVIGPPSSDEIAQAVETLSQAPVYDRMRAFEMLLARGRSESDLLEVANAFSEYLRKRLAKAGTHRARRPDGRRRQRPTR